MTFAAGLKSIQAHSWCALLVTILHSLSKKTSISSAANATAARAESSKSPHQKEFKELLNSKKDCAIAPSLAEQEAAFEKFLDDDEPKRIKATGELAEVEGIGLFPISWLELSEPELWIELLYESEVAHSPWAVRPFESPAEKKVWQAYKKADEQLWRIKQSWDELGYRACTPDYLEAYVSQRKTLREEYFEIASRPPKPDELKTGDIFEMMSGLIGGAAQ